MQISSLMDVVGGYLLNLPSISFITQAHTIPSNVNEGDLFIASCQEDIELAVSNGAFAIICDFYPDIIDKEIAWIKVNSIDNAITRLLRFSFGNKNNTSYYCDGISLELINLLSLSQKYCLLNDDYKNNFELLKNIDENSIIISKEKAFLEAILPSFQDIIIKDFKVDNLVIHSLFTTTFSYNEQLFYKLKLPSLYINHFLTILKFLDEYQDLNKLKDFKYFKPIFLNKEFNIVSFGDTNKFIIANDDLSLVDSEIKYLEENYKYGKIEILNENISLDELLYKAKTIHYNVLYAKGKTVEDLLYIFKPSVDEEKGLFGTVK